MNPEFEKMQFLPFAVESLGFGGDLIAACAGWSWF